jgi:hypothetical protein
MLLLSIISLEVESKRFCQLPAVLKMTGISPMHCIGRLSRGKRDAWAAHPAPLRRPGRAHIRAAKRPQDSMRPSQCSRKLAGTERMVSHNIIYEYAIENVVDECPN